MIFLDPKSDIAFKKLFSNAEHTNILINFLNNTLARPKGEQIVSVTINDPHNHPEIVTGKSSIVDVRCTDQNGSNYILEMQVVNQQDYAERAQYYVAVAIARQLQSNEEYIKITPVIFVGIVNFKIFKSPNCLSHHGVVNLETGERSLFGQEYHFIELKKFDKKLDELTTDFDKWVYFFKNAKALQSIPIQLKKPNELQEAFKVLEQGNWTNKELEIYERSLDAIRSYNSGIATARNEGKEEGKVEGIAEGEMRSKMEIAKQLLDILDVATIAKKTGLSIQDIEKLKN